MTSSRWLPVEPLDTRSSRPGALAGKVGCRRGGRAGGYRVLIGARGPWWRCPEQNYRVCCGSGAKPNVGGKHTPLLPAGLRWPQAYLLGEPRFDCSKLDSFAFGAARGGASPRSAAAPSLADRHEASDGALFVTVLHAGRWPEPGTARDGRFLSSHHRRRYGDCPASLSPVGVWHLSWAPDIGGRWRSHHACAISHGMKKRTRPHMTHTPI